MSGDQADHDRYMNEQPETQGIPIDDVNGKDLVVALFEAACENAYRIGFNNCLTECVYLLNGVFEKLPKDALHVQTLRDMMVNFAELREKINNKKINATINSNSETI